MTTQDMVEVAVIEAYNKGIRDGLQAAIDAINPELYPAGDDYEAGRRDEARDILNDLRGLRGPKENADG